MRIRTLVMTLALLVGVLPNPAFAADLPPRQTSAGGRQNKSGDPVWADFVETNFPFFSSVLDARKSGPGWMADNLTPRGLILNLGHGCWACFDTELLRVSAIWSGTGLTPVSMSQGSYHTAGVKVSEGQDNLPQIVGSLWLANGIYPGWQTGERISMTDPREPAPDQKEVGRGPLDPSAGRFKAIHLTGSGVRLEYEVAGVSVSEWIEARAADGQPVVQRRFRLDRVSQSLWLILGRRPPNSRQNLKMAIAGADRVEGKPDTALVEGPDGVWTVRVSQSVEPVEFEVGMAFDPAAKTWSRSPGENADALPRARWLQTVTTQAAVSTVQDAYVLDNVPLPLENPWKRNVRLADLAFLRDGRAAVITFDGDVWIVSGLEGGLREIRWKRFASGLHEPLSVAVRGEELFVFDRNGIWRLRDTDGNGEADSHELVSNAFAQTAETREFATGMRLAPDGSFIIAKGGQQGSTTGKHNGTVLRAPRDGSTATVLGWGLRMPFIGVHPKTGLVTASDQQGNYVPATPLHIIRDHQFYGFISMLLPKEKYPAPIADPLTWIPHAINASGVGQVWLIDAKMGPLNDALIHIGYYRPELFVVRLNERTSRMQAAVFSLTRNLAFPPLNGAVNPIDGQLYVTGFQIWGTEASQVSGLARLRYTGAQVTLPREVTPMDKGILLRFEVALDAKTASDPANFSAERWNYMRTANYGSAHFKPDGSKGQEAMTPSSAYVSRDGRSVFIGIPDMNPVMQMRLGWTLATSAGATFGQNAYFTPFELTRFDPASEGFEPVTVDLTPRPFLAAAPTPITAAEGKRVSELMGCVACHSTDGSTLGKVGPSWKGLFGSERKFADGTRAVALEDYLRESIREPTAKVVSGFDKSDTGMPSYEGVISDAQIEALVLYLKTLR
jgi:glucose/arabinose dehydrogenase/cytochrome c551/c552